jgi:CheY-like chemotaxis protein
LRILLVEDHADTRRVLGTLLRRAGYDVRAAGTVVEALRLAADEPFDLLVSDIGLPDGSGLDIIRQVKERYGMRGIALSGFGMDEDISRSLAAGFEHHLIKPIDVRVLENLIVRMAC